MIINGSKLEKSDIVSEDINVQHTFSYIYLGSPRTEDGSYT